MWIPISKKAKSSGMETSRGVFFCREKATDNFPKLIDKILKVTDKLPKVTDTL